MTNLSDLERAVIRKLLEKNEPSYDILREQLSVAQVLERRVTGHGFFSTLSLPKNIKPASPLTSLVLRNVVAEITTLQYGAGFLLFINDGVLHMLEGYCFGEEWPANTSNFSLRYLTGEEMSA